MINPVLDQWEDPERDVELLFACQCMDEMLFSYSLDSYRLRTLDTRLRLEEVSATAAQCLNGSLHMNSFEGVVAEAERSIRDDDTCKTLLGEDWEFLVEQIPSKLSSAPEVRSAQLWANTVGRVLAKSYVGQLKEDLCSLIDEGGRRIAVRSTVSNILVELVAVGYARPWLYRQVRTRFFEKASPSVTGVDDLRVFLDQFAAAQKEYRVVIRAQTARDVSRILDRARLPIGVITPPDVLATEEERTFFETEDDTVFVELANVSALDPVSARAEAEQVVARASAALRLLSHGTEVDLSRDALVYGGDRVHTVSETQESAMHMRPDPPRNRMPRLFHNLVGLVEGEALTAIARTRLREALEFHDNAVAARATENQLLNLWTIIEILTVPPMGQRRLSHMLELLIPALTRRYFIKLLANLNADCQRCVEDAMPGAPAIPRRLPEFVDLILMDSRLEERQELLNASEYRNPLLFNRIGSIHHMLRSTRRSQETLKRHRTRVGWQIERIYRARNLILHEGTTPSYTSRLVENLHDYVDYALDVIVRRLSSKAGPNTIAEVLYEERIAAAAHDHFLKNLEGISDENVRRVVFGTDVAEIVQP